MKFFDWLEMFKTSKTEINMTKNKIIHYDNKAMIKLIS